MELNTSTLMMIFFIISLIISIWKIYAFLPNKQLADDDTTKEAQQSIENLMSKVIDENKGNLNEEELLNKMQNHRDFDKKIHWRFNQNKLKQLLNIYYLKHKEVDSIHSLYVKHNHIS